MILNGDILSEEVKNKIKEGMVSVLKTLESDELDKRKLSPMGYADFYGFHDLLSKRSHSDIKSHPVGGTEGFMLDHLFGELKGKTLSDVELVSQDGMISEIIFKLESGEVYKMYHEQECCEDVFVEDITDDIKLLIGKQILQAYKTSNADGPAPEFVESYTWTFYTISTFDISITIRWLGESNGYYSESVSFKRIR